MNTRQKLTLGVAAIFMVTLTIVGVTYAYFVTRVTGALTESAVIETAKIGAIEYVPGNGTSDSITLSNALPGDVKYKTLYVSSGDTLWTIDQAEPNITEYYEGKDIRDIIYNLKYINNLNSNNLIIGEELQIPIL